MASVLSCGMKSSEACFSKPRRANPGESCFLFRPRLRVCVVVFMLLLSSSAEKGFLKFWPWKGFFPTHHLVMSLVTVSERFLEADDDDDSVYQDLALCCFPGPKERS